jgi:hypothetical protein
MERTGLARSKNVWNDCPLGSCCHTTGTTTMRGLCGDRDTHGSGNAVRGNGAIQDFLANGRRPELHALPAFAKVHNAGFLESAQVAIQGAAGKAQLSSHFGKSDAWSGLDDAQDFLMARIVQGFGLLDAGKQGCNPSGGSEEHPCGRADVAGPGDAYQNHERTFAVVGDIFLLLDRVGRRWCRAGANGRGVSSFRRRFSVRLLFEPSARTALATKPTCAATARAMLRESARLLR